MRDAAAGLNILIGPAPARFGHFVPNRHACDPELRAGSIVTLNQDAYRVPTNYLGCRAGTALEAVAGHSSTSPPIALGNGSGRCGIHRGESVFGRDVLPVDVVKAIVGLGHDGHHEIVVEMALADHPFDHRIAHNADRVRVSDHDGALNKTGFLNPRRAGHFAIAVQREPGAKDGVEVGPAARKDGCDAGPDGTFTHDERTRFAFDQRRESDFDASDIGDCVERSGRAVHGKAEVARAVLG